MKICKFDFLLQSLALIVITNCLLLAQMIKEIIKAVTIPVMAKVRIGHFAEAQILEALGVDYIDESEGKVHLYKMY